MRYSSEGKIKTPAAAILACSRHRSDKLRIGYIPCKSANLDAALIVEIESTLEQCDILVVGVHACADNNCDATEQCRIVAALVVVDYVVLLTDDQETSFIAQLVPDIVFSSLNRETPRALAIKPSELRPAVFLDRDGTLIEPVEYLHEPQKLKLFEDTAKSLKLLSQHGFRLVVVSNQPGIGLGYYTKEDLFSTNREMMKQLSASGIYLDRFYYCPHSQAESCTCRKPRTGLVDRAVKDLNIDLKRSYVIGDMTGDIKLGQDAGCKTVLVRTGTKGRDGLFHVQPTHTVETLWDAAQVIVKDSLATTPNVKKVLGAPGLE